MGYIKPYSEPFVKITILIEDLSNPENKSRTEIPTSQQPEWEYKWDDTVGLFDGTIMTAPNKTLERVDFSFKPLVDQEGRYLTNYFGDSA